MENLGNAVACDRNQYTDDSPERRASFIMSTTNKWHPFTFKNYIDHIGWHMNVFLDDVRVGVIAPNTAYQPTEYTVFRILRPSGEFQEVTKTETMEQAYEFILSAYKKKQQEKQHA